MIPLKSLIISMIFMGAICSSSMAQDSEDDAIMESAVPICGNLSALQVATANTSVDTDLASLSFILMRGNLTSVLDMQVFDPSGAAINSSAQLPVIYGEDQTLSFFIIPEPKMGIWTAEITGISVPGEGESYCLVIDLEALEELAPEENLSEEEMAEVCEECAQAE